MIENFITSIRINHSRNVSDLEIPLSQDKRQHLILTGKNGSGKTSLLLELNKFFSTIDNGEIQNFQSYLTKKEQFKNQLSARLSSQEKHMLEDRLKSTENALAGFGGTEIFFSTEHLNIFNKYHSGEFILAFFDSKRHTRLTVPSGIKKIQLKKKYNINEKASTNFIQYIVNLKADRSFARDDNEMDTVEKIDTWFNRLETRLKSIFDSQNLELKFDRRAYNFDIITGEGESFNFNTLSDGYSAIISIISDLLLRMEAHNVKSYDLEGVVLIDEIETHLHVDLQKKILPFLVDFFPKLQFIVTTHSPFILSSVSNATICDLERRTITSDLSNYSYDALIESYFISDKYSDEIKAKISEFDSLISLDKRSPEENDTLRYLRNYFAHAPKYLSKELLVRLQQIKLKELNKKDN
ncbi:MAG: AAA family ATPase [Saprospiraceae bacterium]|nr:AAA family ATPase [Saprospiraceae bacterium]MCB9355811.1 AAA family ATPase [Lewinellaceae bacterium]